MVISLYFFPLSCTRMLTTKTGSDYSLFKLVPKSLIVIGLARAADWQPIGQRRDATCEVAKRRSTARVERVDDAQELCSTSPRGGARIVWSGWAQPRVWEPTSAQREGKRGQEIHLFRKIEFYDGCIFFIYKRRNWDLPLILKCISLWSGRR